MEEEDCGGCGDTVLCACTGLYDQRGNGNVTRMNESIANGGVSIAEIEYVLHPQQAVSFQCQSRICSPEVFTKLVNCHDLALSSL